MMIYREMEQQNDGSTAAVLGYVICNLSHLSEARQYLIEALRLVSESRSFPGFLFILPALTLLLIDQGSQSGPWR
jgi:hypothetical protein